jgi:hypothetical protein
MSGAIPLLPLLVSMSHTGTTLPFQYNVDSSILSKTGCIDNKPSCESRRTKDSCFLQYFVSLWLLLINEPKHVAIKLLSIKKSCDWRLLSLYLPYIRTNWPDWFLSVPSFLILGMPPECRVKLLKSAHCCLCVCRSRRTWLLRFRVCRRRYLELQSSVGR